MLFICRFCKFLITNRTWIYSFILDIWNFISDHFCRLVQIRRWWLFVVLASSLPLLLFSLQLCCFLVDIYKSHYLPRRFGAADSGDSVSVGIAIIFCCKLMTFCSTIGTIGEKKGISGWYEGGAEFRMLKTLMELEFVFLRHLVHIAFRFFLLHNVMYNIYKSFL